MDKNIQNNLLQELHDSLTHGVRIDRPSGVEPVSPAILPFHSDGESGNGIKTEKTDTTETHPDFSESIQIIGKEIQDCQLCGLCLTRNHAVPGMGVFEPLVLVVGDAPGSDEDRQGLPFVGKDGQYLDEWLRALGLSRQETVFVTTLVKCRPPQNREPHPQEIHSCTHYLERQIAQLKPVTILSLGSISSGFFLGGTHRVEDIHGKIFEYRGIPVIPTYHPSAVLQNQDLRRTVWGDLKILHNHLLLKGLVQPLPEKTAR